MPRWVKMINQKKTNKEAALAMPEAKKANNGLYHRLFKLNVSLMWGGIFSLGLFL